MFALVLYFLCSSFYFLFYCRQDVLLQTKRQWIILREEENIKSLNCGLRINHQVGRFVSFGKGFIRPKNGFGTECTLIEMLAYEHSHKNGLKSNTRLRYKNQPHASWCSRTILTTLPKRFHSQISRNTVWWATLKNSFLGLADQAWCITEKKYTISMLPIFLFSYMNVCQHAWP